MTYRPEGWEPFFTKQERLETPDWCRSELIEHIYEAGADEFQKYLKAEGYTCTKENPCTLPKWLGQVGTVCFIPEVEK